MSKWPRWVVLTRARGLRQTLSSVGLVWRMEGVAVWQRRNVWLCGSDTMCGSLFAKGCQGPACNWREDAGLCQYPLYLYTVQCECVHRMQVLVASGQEDEEEGPSLEPCPKRVRGPPP